MSPEHDSLTLELAQSIAEHAAKLRNLIQDEDRPGQRAGQVRLVSNLLGSELRHLDDRYENAFYGADYFPAMPTPNLTGGHNG